MTKCAAWIYVSCFQIEAKKLICTWIVDGQNEEQLSKQSQLSSCAYLQIRSCMQVCTCLYVHVKSVWMCTCTGACMYDHVCMHACMIMYACMHVCRYVCVHFTFCLANGFVKSWIFFTKPKQLQASSILPLLPASSRVFQNVRVPMRWLSSNLPDWNPL